MLKLLLILVPFTIFSQTKIVFTSVDASNDEVRAQVFNENGNNRIDLGFSKTYLPVWFGDKILYNSDTYIWECDTTGENLKQREDGFRISVSHDQTKYAFYNNDGIGIADTSGKIINQVMVEAWPNVTITWSLDDSKISYYDIEKEKCFLFDLKNDSLITFGEWIYHPLWHKNQNKILYNKAAGEEEFDVVIQDSMDFSTAAIINKPGEMAVVPVWSDLGDKIAYLVIKKDSAVQVDSDMLPSFLMLYNLNTKEHTMLADDAGFTDEAFPQISFDARDENIYYTAINENGLGEIKKINLLTREEFTLSDNPSIDDRFPQVKTFK